MFYSVIYSKLEYKISCSVKLQIYVVLFQVILNFCFITYLPRQLHDFMKDVKKVVLKNNYALYRKKPTNQDLRKNV